MDFVVGTELVKRGARFKSRIREEVGRKVRSINHIELVDDHEAGALRVNPFAEAQNL